MPGSVIVGVYVYFGLTNDGARLSTAETTTKAYTTYPSLLYVIANAASALCGCHEAILWRWNLNHDKHTIKRHGG